MIDNLLFFKGFIFKNMRALGIENAEALIGVGLSTQRRLMPCLNGEIIIKHNTN
jgi:hypothetical protein